MLDITKPSLGDSCTVTAQKVQLVQEHLDDSEMSQRSVHHLGFLTDIEHLITDLLTLSPAAAQPGDGC